MKVLKVKYKTGRSPLNGFDYHTTWVLDVGWNRVKINLTQKREDMGGGYCTWYPFSLYWWPPNNQWFRWRILGPRIRLRPNVLI